MTRRPNLNVNWDRPNGPALVTLAVPTDVRNSNGNAGLVQAHRVQPMGDLEEATAVDMDGREKREHEKSKYSCILLVIVATVLLLGCVVGIFVVVNRRRKASVIASSSWNQNQTTVNLTNSTTTATQVSLHIEGLPNYTLESLMDPFSVQSQAWKWLSFHPDVDTMPNWRKKQLLALACFYYGFEGPRWPANLNNDWLS